VTRDENLDASNDFALGGSTEGAKTRYLNSLGCDYGEFRLGRNTTRILYEDPKMLLFILSRHKFVSRVLNGAHATLEIGCQEGFGSLLVKQSTQHLVGIDFYAPYIKSCKERIDLSGLSFMCHDMLAGPVKFKGSLHGVTESKVGGDDEHEFDAAFALDVLEHIDKSEEDLFLENVCLSLRDSATFVCGMPSLESQTYASEASLKGHVNCKTGPELRTLLRRHFDCVLMFSMNDEVLHTGFFPMSSYLFAVGVGPKHSK
jgi:hypothetical protein